jgi:hypothetical protein
MTASILLNDIHIVRVHGANIYVYVFLRLFCGRIRPINLEVSDSDTTTDHVGFGNRTTSKSARTIITLI